MPKVQATGLGAIGCGAWGCTGRDRSTRAWSLPFPFGGACVSSSRSLSSRRPHRPRTLPLVRRRAVCVDPIPENRPHWTIRQYCPADAFFCCSFAPLPENKRAKEAKPPRGKRPFFSFGLFFSLIRLGVQGVFFSSSLVLPRVPVASRLLFSPFSLHAPRRPQEMALCLCDANRKIRQRSMSVDDFFFSLQSVSPRLDGVPRRSRVTKEKGINKQ
nr:hypothetical protein [Pandoravirus massiliensis]